jgi:hypothetical protein
VALSATSLDGSTWRRLVGSPQASTRNPGAAGLQRQRVVGSRPRPLRRARNRRWHLSAGLKDRLARLSPEYRHLTRPDILTIGEGRCRCRCQCRLRKTVVSNDAGFVVVAGQVGDPVLCHISATTQLEALLANAAPCLSQASSVRSQHERGASLYTGGFESWMRQGRQRTTVKSPPPRREVNSPHDIWRCLRIPIHPLTYLAAGSWPPWMRRRG